tara:strand:+ start:2000 stop:3604 length:1605 start_codon:yes stop_codon:yes gene_type:complete
MNEQFVSRVLISESMSLRAEEILSSNEGFEVVNEPKMTREDLLSQIESFDALIVRSGTKVNKELLETGKRLKIVARAGIGVDNIDLDTASRLGVLVVNAPDGNVITTAEHTMGLIFSLARRIPEAVSSLKSGLWERSKFVGSELASKTLGVIGLGRVGSNVARLAKNIGMDIIAFDPYISEEAALERDVKLVSFDEVLQGCDYLTLHVPGTDETSNLLGKNEFQKMKDGIRIVNCARGGLINEEALSNAIDEEKVMGIAMDVYPEEPPPENYRILLERPEVICTPHLGASTEEAQENVAISVAQQVVDYLKDGVVKYAVNLPSLGSEQLERIGPYLLLAENLGSFLAQLVDGGVRKLEIIHHGTSEIPISALSSNAIKGILSHFLGDTRINLVNGPTLAKERGIEIITTHRNSSDLYKDMIEIRLVTDKNERSAIGTITNLGSPKITSIDSFSIDVDPEGFMLVFSNEDRPGTIGTIGTLLGKHQINIAGMQLGRTKKNDKAVAILSLDDLIPENVMEEVRNIPGLLDARSVVL